MVKQHRPDTVFALHECYSICMETFSTHCAKQGGHHMAYEHMRRMLSCIDICALTADFLLRHSPLSQELCDLCAEICKECATSCNGMKDARMNACARACEQAARACLDESRHIKAIAA